MKLSLNYNRELKVGHGSYIAPLKSTYDIQLQYSYHYACTLLHVPLWTCSYKSLHSLVMIEIAISTSTYVAILHYGTIKKTLCYYLQNSIKYIYSVGV